MAKKEVPESDRMKCLMTNVAQKCGGITLGELKSRIAGLPIPYYSERYTRDGNIYIVGQIEMYVGGYGSGKSAYGFHVAQCFLDAGGLFFLVETEHKISPVSLEANLGTERFNCGRVQFIQCDTINAQKEKGEDAIIDSWQGVLTNIVKMVKAQKLENVPIYILVDSLLGPPSDQLAEKIKTEGVASTDTTNLQRAQNIEKYLSTLCSSIAGTNILIGFTNHGKNKVSMGGMPQRGDERSFPGGVAAAFRCALVLWFERRSKEVMIETAGRTINISVWKNSFGGEERQVEVGFQYDLMRDSKGEVVTDEFGHPRRMVTWDWNRATGDLLESLADEEGPMKIKVGAEVRKMAREAIKCLKVKDGASNADVGVALEKSEEAKHALLFCARTSTCMYPELEFATKGEKD